MEAQILAYESSKLSKFRNSIAHFNYRLETATTDLKDDPNFPKDPVQAALIENLARITLASLKIHNNKAQDLEEKDFGQHGFIAAEGQLGNSPITKWLSERVATSNVWSVCNTMSTMAAAASGGIGIAPLPCFLGDTRTDLVRVSEPIPETEVEPVIAYHVSLRKSDRAQALVQYLKRVFAENEALFAGRKGRG